MTGLEIIIPSAMALINKAFDFFGEDDKKQAEILLKQLEYQQEQVMAQTEINKNEAMHRSIFVAGWRPFIGWTCGICVFFAFVVKPYIFPFLYEYYPQLKELPDIDGNLFELMLGMLGLGGLRTFEKFKGVSK